MMELADISDLKSEAKASGFESRCWHHFNGEDMKFKIAEQEICGCCVASGLSGMNFGVEGEKQIEGFLNERSKRIRVAITTRDQRKAEAVFAKHPRIKMVYSWPNYHNEENALRMWVIPSALVKDIPVFPYAVKKPAAKKALTKAKKPATMKSKTVVKRRVVAAAPK
jgi:hypothetical protein